MCADRGLRSWLPPAIAVVLAAATGCSTAPVAGDGAAILVARAAASSGEAGAERTFIALAGEGAEPLILAEEFWSSSSPAPSFDAARILFRGRRSQGESAAIWVMRSTGSRPGLVTRGFGDPDHPAWLPDGRVIWSDLVPGEGSTVRTLYGAAADGGDAARLTFGRHEDWAPAVLADGRVLFTRRFLGTPRSGESILMTIHPDGTGIARFDPDLSSARPARAPARATALPRWEGYEVLSAVDLASAAPPPILTSVVRDGAATGTLLCLDAYESVDALPPGLARGSIASVIVNRDMPPGGGATREEVFLGEAPVHPDGSFFVEVPADTPLRLDLVGGRGEVIASTWSGIWVRPNENRGCVGCHEPPDLVPENRRPAAVLSAPARALGPSAPENGDARASR